MGCKKQRIKGAIDTGQRNSKYTATVTVKASGCCSEGNAKAGLTA